MINNGAGKLKHLEMPEENVVYKNSNNINNFNALIKIMWCRSATIQQKLPKLNCSHVTKE